MKTVVTHQETSRDVLPRGLVSAFFRTAAPTQNRGVFRSGTISGVAFRFPHDMMYHIAVFDALTLLARIS